MKKLFIGIIFLTALITCTQEEITSRAYPRIRTISVTSIESAGVVFRGEITFTTSEIIDHGFVWSSNQSLDLTKVEKVRLGSKPGAGIFEANVGFGLAQGEKYYFKAFVQSDTHIVYGETLEFVSLGSLAPVLEDFSPKEATWNDTITLRGRNFSGQVRFGETQAEIIERNDKTIKVKVPLEYTQQEGFISVIFAGNTSASKDKFKLLPPVINDFTPKHGKFGDPITISGNYFHPFQLIVNFNDRPVEIVARTKNEIIFKVPTGFPSGNLMLEVVSGAQKVSALEPFYYESPLINEIVPNEGTYGDIITLKGNYFGSGVGDNLVKFEDKVAEIISTSTTEIKIKVPISVAVSKSNVTVLYNQQISSPATFSLLPPVINSFSPNVITTGTDIVIEGTRFSPVLSNNKVMIAGIESEIINSTPTQITVKGPLYINSHNLAIEVKSSGSSATALGMLKSPWARIANFPDSDSPATTITIDEKLFVQTSYLRFVEYDATRDSWNSQASIPSASYLSWAFSIDSKIYAGSYGNNWLYEYNLTTDMWVQSDYFPFYALPSTGIGLATSNYGFLFSSENELWKYDPNLDSWQKQSSYPNLYYIQGSTVGDDLYILGYNETTGKMELWRYDTVSNEWLNLSISLEVSVLEPYDIVYFFAIGNRIYLGNANNTTYAYDSQTNVWTRGLNIPGPAIYSYGKVLFSSGSKGYIIFDEGQLWEFDPSYLP